MENNSGNAVATAVLRHLRTVFWSKLVRSVAFWAAFVSIVGLSLMPGFAVDATFSADVQSHDRDFHAISYIVLSALFLASHVKRGKASAIVRLTVFAAFTGLGGLLELLQSTSLIGRSASWGDFTHNAAGAAIGALLPAFFLLPGRKAGSDVSA